MIPIQDNVPSRNPPITIYALIAINVVVFIMQLGLSPDDLQGFFYVFGIVPARYTHPWWAEVVGLPLNDYWPFLTSMFLHGGLLHLAGNMWMLWIFGDNVEDRMGPARFLVFYLLCGLAAGVVHWLTNPDSTLPTVGASGAISGVMGMYFLLYPQAQIIVMVPVLFFPFFFRIPAVLFLGVWFLVQLVSGMVTLAGPPSVGGIAWWAHLGGFVAGAVLGPLFLKSKPPERRCQPDEYGVNCGWVDPKRVRWSR